MSDISKLISVVVPTYNREALVIEALESIKKQTYRPIEIVIVDDGSKDHTRKKVNEWKTIHDNNGDFTVKYVYQQNKGGNVARNNGIQESNGEFIAFLDSDDLWLKDKLTKQMRCFENGLDVGAVYCGLRQINAATGEIIDDPKRLYPHGWIFNQMIVHDVTAPTSTYIIRKDVFMKTGMFDVELQARQDWDMMIRVSRYYQVLCVGESLVDFRHHPGIRTASNPKKEIIAYQKILNKYMVWRQECSINIRQAALSAYYRRMGKVYYHYMGKRYGALKWYVRAIAEWPFDFNNYAAIVGLLLQKDIRVKVYRAWNKIFGGSGYAIKSH